ncbi:DNA circularization N-terminal domain-containing protein [Lonsdalea quercina]|uniref:DNA circularization protein n=1 Tax=Lonsdalea quercina TaxID=71657 RepID=UPI003F481CBD
MSWIDNLHDASLRGVKFKISGDEAQFGRRVQVHEYPNRDKPYSEDLGRATRHFSVEAYVIGDDFMEQRNRLIQEIEKEGPATLIHPYYGEMSITINELARISHANDEGRMCRIAFSFVEAGELSFPTAGLATGKKLASSVSWLDECIESAMEAFGLDGLPDFINDGVLDDASAMMDFVTDAFKYVDAGVTAAARLMNGDLTVLLGSGSSAMNFVNRLQTMWRAGTRLSGDTKSLVSMITGLTGVTAGHDLAPRGVWSTDSTTTQSRKTQSNHVAQAIRVSAISEAAYTVTSLPKPAQARSSSQSLSTSSSNALSSGGGASSAIVTIPHPAVTDIDTSEVTTNAGTTTSTAAATVPSWDVLTEVRESLNTAIDRELERVTDDTLFQALVRVRSDVNSDISSRLVLAARVTERRTTEVLPAIVLAADWYDSVERADEIMARNNIQHPGFVPVTTLRVPTQ